MICQLTGLTPPGTSAKVGKFLMEKTLRANNHGTPKTYTAVCVV